MRPKGEGMETINSPTLVTDAIVLRRQSDRGPIIYIASDDVAAREVHRYMEYLEPGKSVYIPEWEVLPYDYAAPSRRSIAARLYAVYRIKTVQPRLCIATPWALMKKTVSPDVVEDEVIVLKTGEEIDREELIEKLIDRGYERITYVEKEGDLAPRGMVLDIFPVGQSAPLRVLFDGDVIEEISRVDIKTQLKLDRVLEPILILPCREGGRQEEAGEENPWILDPDIPLHSLREIISPTEIVLVPRTEDLLQKTLEEIERLYELSKRDVAPPDQLFDTELPAQIEEGQTPVKRIVRKEGEFLTNREFRSDPLRIFQRVEEVLDEEGTVVFSAPEKVYLDRLVEEVGARSAEVGVCFEIAPFTKGFFDKRENLLWITVSDYLGVDILPTDRDLFRAQPLEYHEEIDFTEGDYVVHTEYGIGIYRGIERVEALGKVREYLKLEYADGDVLFVPLYQINLVHKYRSIEETPPKLDRIHRSNWSRARARAEKSAEQFARKLIELYALRAAVKGVRFEELASEEMKFASGFRFVETEDQIKAIEAVNRDMSSEKPMDRLLCGDSGYGKTEVALRAAFRAVSNGYQVAFLAPTTLLAHQHFLTFESRFKLFPYRVELLSRFQTAAQAKEILEGLRSGEVDICIGTHRLLGKNVAFRKLGLVIIDEEQRFGVRQKERLKTLRRSADVLTMTATPIPRTLQMAISRIKDLSLITTPPGGRIPVRTTVASHNDELVREFIRRELSRHGQVYYLYNRVKTIYRVAERLQEWFPEATIAVVHGQMKEREIEDVFSRFYHSEVDVLICSTIIENGIDIPTANTIIVENSDRFGLSQLYQIRGRVGRSTRQAYAYFSYRNPETLTGTARRRLQALKEMDRQGTGFEIAMRDLEIRGAGELLGKRQAGNVVDVGFEIYTSLVNRAVRRLKGEELVEERVATVELAVEYGLPSDYINSNKLRLQFYRKLSRIESVSELEEIRFNLEDRFGPLPVPALRLLQLLELKILSETSGVVSLQELPDRLVIDLNRSRMRLDVLRKVFKEAGAQLNEPRARLTFAWDEKSPIEDRIDRIKNILQRVKG